MRCFCGCDAKVPFGVRAVNKRGEIIDGDVETVRMMLRQGMQSPNAEQFVGDGEALLAVLADAVHTGTDPGPELEEETRGYMAFARHCFGDLPLGLAIENSGLSHDEAIALMTQGEWDPFADVPMP